MISCTEGSLYWCSYQPQSSADVLLLAICHCDELKLYFTLLYFYTFLLLKQTGKVFKTLEKKLCPPLTCCSQGVRGGAQEIYVIVHVFVVSREG